VTLTAKAAAAARATPLCAESVTTTATGAATKKAI
jgi:hypothetical protein